MNLLSKKRLAAKTLGVGAGRIIFDTNRIDEVKEAITKQDIRDLNSSGAIKIREVTGRRRVEKSQSRRRMGKIRKKIVSRKGEYVIITRKLRLYVKNLKDQGKITDEKYKEMRSKIKMKMFKSKRHFKEALE